MTTRILCAECGSDLGDAWIGLRRCDQCHTEWIWPMGADQPHTRVPIKSAAPTNPRMDQGTRSFQFEIGSDGVPRYWCIQCWKQFPVSHCKTTKQVRIHSFHDLGSKYGGTITEEIIRKASRLVEWRDRRTIYERHNGVMIARTTAQPIFIQGPVCPTCN